MNTGPGAHSPVGGSTAKRLLKCLASVGLSRGIQDDESEHAAMGTAVHSIIEKGFLENSDAWMQVGQPVVTKQMANVAQVTVVTKQMANAAQVMLDAVRKAHPDRNQGNFWVERRFRCPTIHVLFFGTSDIVFWDEDAETLHIWDYKNGAGVIIEVEGNEQGMYYACGILEDLQLWDICKSVVIHIVQPNGFHSDGPVREWETTPDHLAEWMEDTMVPGLRRALELADTPEVLSKNTASGEHCRFCPARTHACPQLLSDMDELEAMMVDIAKTGADALTASQLARFLHLKEVAKIVGKAAESTAFKRINAGARIEGWKLSKAKANRAWKEGADIALQAEFGPKAMTDPNVKSPAQIDDLPLGTAFTTRWAYKPDTGLTLVRDTDTRPEVSTDTKSLFSPVPKTVKETPAPIAAPADGGRRKRPALALVGA